MYYGLDTIWSTQLRFISKIGLSALMFFVSHVAFYILTLFKEKLLGSREAILP